MNNPNLRNNVLNNGGNNAKGETSAKETECIISAIEFSEFPNSVRSAILLTTDIQDKISEILSEVYKDFIGVIITPVSFTDGPGNRCNNFQITLYFDDANEIGRTGKTRAFATGVTSTTNTQTNSKILAELRSTADRMVAKAYTLSNHGKSGLAQFVSNGWKNNGIVDWNSIINRGGVFEKQDPQRGLIVGVTGIFDIVSFLKLIYGTKSTNGEVYQYEINPIAPAGGNMMGSTPAWLLMVNQFEMKELERAGRKAGIGGFTVGTQMTTRR